MRFGAFKIGKSKEKPDRDAIEADDTTASQVANNIKNKTKKLKKAEQQLIELSETANGSEKGEDSTPKPHGPLVELTIEPEEEKVSEEKDEPVDKEKNTITISGKTGAQMKTAEAAAPTKIIPPAKVAAEAEAKKPTAAAEKNDSISDLFNQEDDETNPLVNLINSLPDVTVQELIDDLQEIKEIIRETHKK
jgi:hypothetical protein